MPGRPPRMDSVLHCHMYGLGIFMRVREQQGAALYGLRFSCLYDPVYGRRHHTQLKLGNAAGGVTWLYFGAFFALGSALNYGTSFFASIYHWELDSSILGYEWAVLAIILILTTPIFVRYAPAAATISIVGADVGFASLSLIYCGYNGAIMLQLSRWAFFVAGLLGIVMAAGGILQSAGMAFPMGKPLINPAS